MDEATRELLLTLAEDAEESDGYCCFEIVEPYVNANRLKQLSDHEMCLLLIGLVERNVIDSFALDPDSVENVWLPSKPTIWNARSLWYHITSKGTEMLNGRI
jgi:hypothetical protein